MCFVIERIKHRIKYIRPSHFIYSSLSVISSYYWWLQDFPGLFGTLRLNRPEY